MVTMILLVGKSDSGKTKTLNEFFGVGRWSKGYHEKIINGKIVCVVGFRSPQESDWISFCKFELVIKDINERLKNAETEVKKKHDKDDFVFVIPFTLKREDGRINEDCILKPIEDLRDKGHIVVPIYLNRTHRKQQQLYDEFMKELTIHVILSREEYIEQAKELSNLIKIS